MRTESDNPVSKAAVLLLSIPYISENLTYDPSDEEKLRTLIEKFYNLSLAVRKNGLLSLEDEVKSVKLPYAANVFFDLIIKEPESISSGELASAMATYFVVRKLKGYELLENFLSVLASEMIFIGYYPLSLKAHLLRIMGLQ